MKPRITRAPPSIYVCLFVCLLGSFGQVFLRACSKNLNSSHIPAVEWQILSPSLAMDVSHHMQSSLKYKCSPSLHVGPSRIPHTTGLLPPAASHQQGTNTSDTWPYGQSCSQQQSWETRVSQWMKLSVSSLRVKGARDKSSRNQSYTEKTPRRIITPYTSTHTCRPHVSYSVNSQTIPIITKPWSAKDKS